VPRLPPSFGEGYKFHVTGLTHAESGFPTNDPQVSGELITRLDKKIRIHEDEIVLYDELESDDADILIVAFGCTARSAMEAVHSLREKGVRVGLFKPKTLWPFPEKRYLELIKGKKCVIVPELNLGQLIMEVDRITRGRVKVTGLNKVTGEMISPYEIISRVREELL
jgi:2-oxoglutarate ferredoxin oxidoreductase subunit alpha